MNSIAAAELLAIAAAIHFPSAKFYCQFANADVVSAAGIATDRPLGMGIPTAGLCMFRRKDPVDALQAALVSILESF
jgi:hypothetical protein